MATHFLEMIVVVGIDMYSLKARWAFSYRVSHTVVVNAPLL